MTNRDQPYRTWRASDLRVFDTGFAQRVGVCPTFAWRKTTDDILDNFHISATNQRPATRDSRWRLLARAGRSRWRPAG